MIMSVVYEDRNIDSERGDESKVCTIRDIERRKRNRVAVCSPRRRRIIIHTKGIPPRKSQKLTESGGYVIFLGHPPEATANSPEKRLINEV